MAEPLGRPKTLNRRHKIELPFDMEEVEKLVGIHESAQVAKGFLSTNAGVIIAVFGALSAMLAFEPTQRLAAQYIAFWRHQVTSFIVDAVSGVVPSAETIIDDLVEGAKSIPETAAEAFRRIQQELGFGSTDPSGLEIVLTEEQKRALREAGEQPPL